MTTPILDCILVGHNEGNYQEYVRRQKQADVFSGAYREVKTNSILFNGERVTYMDLLNHGITRATGRQSKLTSFGPTNLASCYLKNFLTRCGLSAEIVNSFQPEKSHFADLLSEPHRLVAITSTFYVEPTPVKEIVSFVRAHSPESRIIVGGPFVLNLCAANDEETQDFLFEQIGADIYVREAQGELTLSRVLMALRQSSDPDLSKIENLIYREGPGRFRRSSRLAEDNVLNENSIDWSRFDPHYLEPMTLVRTARSCAFSCSFCNYPRMAGALKLTDVDVVEHELRQLEEAGVRYVHFIDDTFNVPIRRFKELCRMMIKNKFSFRWMSFLRAANADSEAIDLMAESNCFGSLLGIESGDPTILTNMNKRATPEAYEESIRQLKANGVTTYGMFFVGFPGETEATVTNTFEFIKRTEPDFFVTGQWYCDSLSPIAERAAEFGLVGAGYNWKHNTMNWREAADWVVHYYQNVKATTIMPLTGFSFETIPYLLGLGMRYDKVKEFARIAHRMLVKTIDDVPKDLAQEENELISVCGEIYGDNPAYVARQAMASAPLVESMAVS